MRSASESLGDALRNESEGAGDAARSNRPAEVPEKTRKPSAHENVVLSYGAIMAMRLAAGAETVW
jgi:hypothetical protein